MADVLEHGNNSVSVNTWRIDVDEPVTSLKRKLISMREQRIAQTVLVCRPPTIRKVFKIVSALHERLYLHPHKPRASTAVDV